MLRNACFAVFSLFFLTFCVFGDTFIHKHSGDKFSGYATSKQRGEKTLVVSGGEQKYVSLGDYEIERNFQGRNRHVGCVSIPDAIMLNMETEAFGEGLNEEIDKGPLFIIVEIDSPGGRVDLAQDICNTIIDVDEPEIVAYVTGGKTGGALSAAAAAAFSCDRLFMNSTSTIGAATMITTDEGGNPLELGSKLGEDIGEKFSSAWRNYLASLAEKNHRPGILAKAMEDKDIEVIEIEDRGVRRFIDSVNKMPHHTKVRTWCKPGELLTLTAKQAELCGIADKVVTSREHLLEEMGAANVKVVKNTRTDEARELYGKIDARLKKLGSNLDGGIKELQATHSYRSALRATREIIGDLKKVMLLKRRFGDDIPMSEEAIQSALNSYEAYYQSLRTQR